MLTIGDSDFSAIAQNVEYTSRFNDGAGVLTFEYPTYKTRRYPNGAQVVFKYADLAPMFFGWLFTTEQDNDTYKVTCYDQLRYFKSSNSILRPANTTLTVFLNTVAYSCGDRVRLSNNIDSTEVKLGKYLFDNKTHLDMIYQTIKDNLVANGYWYVLRDEFGALSLRDMVDLRLPIVIGTNSLATKFDYSRSIDEDTFNFIKVAKDDSKKGVRNTYVSQDSGTIGTWGKLMYYDKVSADLNDSQLAERSRQLLKLKNRETQTLKFTDCVGDTRIFGGHSVKVELPDASINTWAVVNSVKHKFSRYAHTMDLELLFVW